METCVQRSPCNKRSPGHFPRVAVRKGLTVTDIVRKISSYTINNGQTGFFNGTQ